MTIRIQTAFPRPDGDLLGYSDLAGHIPVQRMVAAGAMESKHIRELKIGTPEWQTSKKFGGSCLTSLRALDIWHFILEQAPDLLNYCEIAANHNQTTADLQVVQVHC